MAATVERRCIVDLLHGITAIQQHMALVKPKMEAAQPPLFVEFVTSCPVIEIGLKLQ